MPTQSDKRSLLPPGRPASASLFDWQNQLNLSQNSIPSKALPLLVQGPYTSLVFSNHRSCHKMASYRSAEIATARRTPMLRQAGKIGAIRRNVVGKACTCCGNRSYQLVLRSVNQSQVGKLFARCIQCQRPREIDEDLGRILWM